ncbi:hypothetical protein J2T56_001965 [Natronobacillus azotifigens]
MESPESPAGSDPRKAWNFLKKEGKIVREKGSMK